MRVIAGTFKGVRLTAPTGEIARPTTDRVKESMFHLIGMDWSGGIALDLFAGSGALGLEAVSRGADLAILVDRHPRAVAAIHDNVARCRAANQVQVWRMDWRSAVTRVARTYGRVRWVFVDPPYAAQLWVPVLQALAAEGVEVTSCVVCEHPRHVALPEQVSGFALHKLRTYGDITVSLYAPVKE
ncbi:MAG: 16S rRNA (guanine(966)-N(2))-methyltransferase RsmD [Thermoflavifilum sp.]|nr:16S rRNA (guanine(966)-N(2))-methyltransferase RsmD [Thermoflavifilum sp.]MCL6513328.1 16S rRNA (guanine(966)-N(2))-methyltransferase RsmD [Alicyclobacillus sp.]